MPTLNKLYSITITPQQFVDACSDIELQELDILLDQKFTNWKPGNIQRLDDPPDQKPASS
jgi:hypothetical protein